jgi:hypothetical protein
MAQTTLDQDVKPEKKVVEAPPVDKPVEKPRKDLSDVKPPKPAVPDVVHVKVRVAKGKVLFEPEGRFEGGRLFITTQDRAKQLGKDVEVLEIVPYGRTGILPEK